MQRVLTFEQTPSLSVPLRFFLTAPAFAILASLLLLWSGPDMLVSRWTPETLAFTHLLTLGFLTMCMLGALLQILPVVAGIEIPRAGSTATAIHTLLATGTLTLAAAFLTSAAVLFKLALLLLVSAFAWLLIALVKRVWSADHGGPMLTAIRLALSSLAVTVTLGGAAASGFAWPLALPMLLLTDLHAAWGLLGWVGLLVVGIAYQVVPMFQVTPLYPGWMMRRLAWSVALLLAVWTMASIASPGGKTALLVSALLAAAYAAFSLATFALLRQRKRPKPDPTTLFWRTSLASLLACVLLWTWAAFHPAVANHPAYPLLTGALFLVGFAYSVINGMLYKIVPFLVWYHLQNRLEGGCAKAPNVRQILPDAPAERQFRVHLAALLLLVAATLLPRWFAHVAALAFAVSSTWLWWNLASAARLYRSMTADASALRAVPAQRPS